VIDRLKNPDRVTATYSADRSAASLATTGWLSARLLVVPPGFGWDVTIALGILDRPVTITFDGKIETRFHVSISANEWGYFFCHQGKVSWIRVTDNVSVHERDEYNLASATPPLRDLGRFLAGLEAKHALRFRREHAAVRTNIVDGAEPIKQWIVDEL
jgi:hypothetical protein